MPHLAVETQIVTQPYHRAVDARPNKSLLQQILEQVAVFALLPADQRSENRILRIFRQQLDPLQNLLAGLGRDLTSAVRTMPLPGPREQHPQVIVDFGDRADGRSRIVSA